MWLNTLRFISLLFTALALVPGLAHLLEMYNKMKLSTNEYLIVQKIYMGWAQLGIITIISILSTFALTIKVHSHPQEFNLLLSASVCIICTQLIFWIFTFPVNAETK